MPATAPNNYFQEYNGGFCDYITLPDYFQQ